MFSLRLEAGADRRGLILDWWLDRPDASEPIDPASVGTATLLDDVESIALGFYGPPPDGGEPAWSPDWPPAAGLPALIRLRVVFPPGDGRTWPDLVIAPRLRPAARPRS